MNKKNIFALIVVLLVSACTSPTPTEPPILETEVLVTESVVSATSPSIPVTKLNVCYSATSPTQIALWYGYENGIFEKYHLDVELALISGGSKAITALVAGDVDICQVGASPVVNAVVAQQDVVYIAGLMNFYPGGLYTTADITSFEDLNGKTIAVSQAGGANYVMTYLILEQFGLTPNENIATLEVGTEAERYAALEAGQVDAALLFPPLMLKAEQSGFTNLYDLTEVKLPYQFLGVATSNALIRENRFAIDSFLRAIIESVVLMKQDPAGTKVVLAKYLELDPVTDAEGLTESYNTIVLETIESKPYPSIESIQAVIDTLVSENPDVVNLSPEGILDLTILQEIESSGFFETLP